MPVIANATARPYSAGTTAGVLTDQIVQPVRWTETVRHLLDAGVTDFVELGGTVLTKLVEQTRAASRAPVLRPQDLGSAAFRERHGLRFAYVAERDVPRDRVTGTGHPAGPRGDARLPRHRRQ